ncbi:MAG: biopolymer transporter ExbD [Burkholderiales bacterium]|jgi:biopolymer transport protein ExbD|nr:biopolymer transporter ExbD [Burkholderiales bacterium]
MKFRTRAFREEPEINFIPLIDVLLVILIFLMVTTTYSRFAELQINLPTAEAGKAPERPEQIDVGVDAKGNYTINKVAVAGGNAAALGAALKSAAGDMKDPVVVINADANAAHQAVVRVMEAAQRTGYSRITFTTQAPK